MAAVSGIEKKTIVRAKMAGTPNEDLWIAHTVAARTARQPDELLEARRRSPGWTRALADLGIGPEELGERVGAAVRRNASDADITRAAVDQVLSRRLGVDPAGLRSAGATDPEAIAASLLSRLSGQTAEGLYRSVKDGRSTWGGLFDRMGVAPADIDTRVGALLR